MSTTWADLRGTYDERLAIAANRGLPEDEANALALSETYAEAKASAVDPRGILCEHAANLRRRHHPDIMQLMNALGLSGAWASTCGVGYVVPGENGYRPVAEGEMGRTALIAPVVERGQLADLAAWGLNSRRTVTRLGAVSVLGADEIERGREIGGPLLVFDGLYQWLRGHGLGIVIVDWPRVAAELEGISVLACSERLAPRLYEATRSMWHPPTINVPTVAEGSRLAA